MVFSRPLYVLFLLYTVDSGESRTLKNDLNLEKEIALAPPGRNNEVNQVPSNHVKRTSVAPADSYSSDVDKLFKQLFPSDLSCLNTAQGKSATIKDPKVQRAVQLVNIYTQDCKAYAGSTGKPLYATLNADLRSGSPTKMWGEMGRLLSQGLVILGPKNFPNLYRGCHCEDVRVGTPFTFKQFASTTTNPKVALQFLLSPPGKSFIGIKTAKGTDIQPYSYFPGEREILLDPDVNLSVVQVETDINRIRAEIKKISPTTVIPDNTVAKYVVLDGSKKGKGSFLSQCICGGNP